MRFWAKWGEARTESHIAGRAHRR